MLQVYDRVLASGNGATLLMLSLIVGGLFVLMGLLEWVRSLLVIRVGERLDEALHGRVYDASFERNLAGGQAQASQALNDLTQLRQFVTGNALFAFFDAPWFPVYLLVIFLFHPWLGVAALLGAGVLLALAVLNERWSRQPLAQASALQIAANQLASAHLRNAEAIEAMGMLTRLRARWARLHGAFIDRQNLASERAAAVSAATRTVRIALQSAMLGMGALLAIEGQITAGMMIAGSILIGRMLAPIEQVIGVWRQWTAVQLAHGRLDALLAAHPRRAPRLPLPRPQGRVAVEAASLVPPGGAAPTLINVSFTLAPGEVLGVMGASGSGKSSLARLLVGVWPPRVGKVRLDGADLQGWDRSAAGNTLGDAIGYLPQDVALFGGTVAENIARFGQPDADRVIDAARLAGVHELVLRLPQGYDTVLAEGGTGLSGGQKQRIALARALYGQPALVVLDEPNAHLDQAGEAALAETLRALKQAGATVVLITHRPGILTATDRLLVLQAGQVHKLGPTAEVLAARQPAPASRGAGAPSAPSPASPVRPAGAALMPGLSYRLGARQPSPGAANPSSDPGATTRPLDSIR
ncbi:MAG: Type I secretion system ATP-binding protein PrsD [Paracidovorax wautersii]|uniref:Type I secretion system ATP-binding protein PrsD n=1 Tax=Paracidovorax wautersii TaxID=1177982 RepID=A0A7V8FNH8_9BURK|nr:MAG: Type I secretion system ATP-binding protein PrsD [Paracidovorax wautersii]